MKFGLSLILLGVLLALAIDRSEGTYVPKQEWDNYKLKFNKDYAAAGISESLAQYYYAYNKKLITNHNNLYDRGQKTFSLRINQYTDMRLVDFNARFPVATPLQNENASPAPLVNVAPVTYNPFNFGFRFNIEDQGIKCNSGWSYAAAKSIEILQAYQQGSMNPVSNSAQNLIDCSGRSTACRSQVPQTAFDYLAVHKMDLFTVRDYRNNNSLSEPGMCLAKGTTVTKLDQYSKLLTDDDFTLKAYVGAGFPVVIEFNPTSFEFMHFGEGVFQPPKISTKGSHFMTVLGYDRDNIKGLDYWIVQNSFGNSWGENGLMRVLRSPTVKLAKNSIFPTILG